MVPLKRIFAAAGRLLFILVAGVLLIWSLLPLTTGIVNAGVLVSVPIAFLLFITGVLWEPIKSFFRRVCQKRTGRVIVTIASALLIALLALFLVASGFMLHAAARPPEKQATVIVLGAAIKGDQPCSMLADRLDTAANYLEANKDSACVVSGGKGRDEQYSEAEVMARYLVNKGIDPSRIYLEDRSRNTEENIRFSRAVIEENDLNPRIVIATQEFHQYRAQELAKKQGFDAVGPATCRTSLRLLECYWVREFAAVCRLWILG